MVRASLILDLRLNLFQPSRDRATVASALAQPAAFSWRGAVIMSNIPPCRLSYRDLCALLWAAYSSNRIRYLTGESISIFPKAAERLVAETIT